LLQFVIGFECVPEQQQLSLVSGVVAGVLLTSRLFH
jgi:hypothetical protein